MTSCPHNPYLLPCKPQVAFVSAGGALWPGRAHKPALLLAQAAAVRTSRSAVRSLSYAFMSGAPQKTTLTKREKRMPALYSQHTAGKANRMTCVREAGRWRSLPTVRNVHRDNGETGRWCIHCQSWIVAQCAAHAGDILVGGTP